MWSPYSTIGKQESVRTREQYYLPAIKEHWNCKITFFCYNFQKHVCHFNFCWVDKRISAMKNHSEYLLANFKHSGSLIECNMQLCNTAVSGQYKIYTNLIPGGPSLPHCQSLYYQIPSCVKWACILILSQYCTCIWPSLVFHLLFYT